MSTEEKNQDPETISENPVNVLFNTSSIAKKDVWEIDIVGILEMLLRILGKSGKKDLRVAGMAALSSSLIYRMKVESIFALHRAAMEKKSSRVRSDVDIPLLGIIPARANVQLLDFWGKKSDGQIEYREIPMGNSS